MVCPFGCVCHAVRAPGEKWTLLALRRDGPDGVATGSTYTTPLNHSRGPVADSTVFLVIFIVALPISRYTSRSSRSLASCPNLFRAFTALRAAQSRKSSRHDARRPA